MDTGTTLLGRALRCRTAGGGRLFTRGFSVRRSDLDELGRLAAALGCSPPEVMATAIQLLIDLDGHPLDRLMWTRETVVIPHHDAWSATDGERIGPCFARLAPGLLAEFSACARRHGASLDVAASAAVAVLATAQRCVGEGFDLTLTAPVALPAAVRPRPRVAISRATWAPA